MSDFEHDGEKSAAGEHESEGVEKWVPPGHILSAAREEVAGRSVGGGGVDVDVYERMRSEASDLAGLIVSICAVRAPWVAVTWSDERRAQIVSALIAVCRKHGWSWEISGPELVLALSLAAPASETWAAFKQDKQARQAEKEGRND